jgi:hypothetical protein
MRSSRPRKARAQDDKYLISHSEECSDVRISSFNVFKKSKKGGNDGRRKKKKRENFVRFQGMLVKNPRIFRSIDDIPRFPLSASS